MHDEAHAFTMSLHADPAALYPERTLLIMTLADGRRYPYLQFCGSLVVSVHRAHRHALVVQATFLHRASVRHAFEYFILLKSKQQAQQIMASGSQTALRHETFEHGSSLARQCAFEHKARSWSNVGEQPENQRYLPVTLRFVPESFARIRELLKQH